VSTHAGPEQLAPESAIERAMREADKPPGRPFLGMGLC
jgi:hypothetical protein